MTCTFCLKLFKTYVIQESFCKHSLEWGISLKRKTGSKPLGQYNIVALSHYDRMVL